VKVVPRPETVEVTGTTVVGLVMELVAVADEPQRLVDVATPGTDHSWPTQHQAWDNGVMDAWITAQGPYTMGYCAQEDIPFPLGTGRGLHDLRQLPLLGARCSVLGARCSARPTRTG
jgi:hypothetical protein